MVFWCFVFLHFSKNAFNSIDIPRVRLVAITDSPQVFHTVDGESSIKAQLFGFTNDDEMEVEGEDGDDGW